MTYDHPKFVWVQTLLFEEDAIKLKKKSGKSNLKAAVAVAVYHYLECEEKL